MAKPVTTLGPFAGINNRLPDHQLNIVERGRKAGDYLRNAVNVDLTSSGTLRRRKGSALVQSGTDCHSLWVGWRSGVLRGWRHALPAPAHVAEGVNLDTALALAIDDALHTHQAEAVTLTAALTLIVADTLHEHLASNIGIYIPTPTADLLRRSVFVRLAQQHAFVRVDEQRIFIRVQ